MVAGASAFLKEKLFLLSDKYKMPVCTSCGLSGHPNKKKCKSCDGDLVQVNIPYASKLLIQELLSMGIATRLIPEKNYQERDRNLVPNLTYTSSSSTTSLEKTDAETEEHDRNERNEDQSDEEIEENEENEIENEVEEEEIGFDE